MPQVRPRDLLLVLRPAELRGVAPQVSRTPTPNATHLVKKWCFQCRQTFSTLTHNQQEDERIREMKEEIEGGEGKMLHRRSVAGKRHCLGRGRADAGCSGGETVSAIARAPISSIHRPQPPVTRIDWRLISRMRTIIPEKITNMIHNYNFQFDIMQNNFLIKLKSTAL